MTKQERATIIANQILEAFEAGDVPASLAKVFLSMRIDGDRPCDRWSWNNRFLAAMQGHPDARGFRQWKRAGRSVVKGEKARYILGPVTIKVKSEDEDGDEDQVRVVGFRGIPVFGLDQTEGDDVDDPVVQFLDSLPLAEVAEDWGIKVRAFESRRCAGSTDGESRITLHVENLSTWAHELVHCAEARIRGGLEPGQDPDQEIVAELGGAVLLECLGLDREADRGGAWEYIKRYSGGDSTAALRKSQDLVTRTCEAVAHILDAAERLAA